MNIFPTCTGCDKLIMSLFLETQRVFKKGEDDKKDATPIGLLYWHVKCRMSYKKALIRGFKQAHQMIEDWPDTQPGDES